MSQDFNIIKESGEDDARALQEEIDKNEALKNTIFQEITDCERFISELRIVDVPLRLLDTFRAN